MMKETKEHSAGYILSGASNFQNKRMLKAEQDRQRTIEIAAAKQLEVIPKSNINSQ